MILTGFLADVSNGNDPPALCRTPPRQLRLLQRFTSEGQPLLWARRARARNTTAFFLLLLSSTRGPSAGRTGCAAFMRKASV